MDAHSFFLILLLVFIFARVFGELFAMMGMVAVLGEIVAGLMLGPSGFGWIQLGEHTTFLKVLAEIGIMLLLFEIGFETDLQQLKRAGRQSIVLALAGALIPFSAGLSTALAFGLELAPSLFIAGTLTATSIGITMRVLKDLDIVSSKLSQVILGAAVIDDLIGVLFLAFVYDYVSTGELSLGHSLKVFAFIVVFFTLAPVLSKFTAKAMRALSFKRRVPGFIPTFIVSLILGFSYIASLLGIPEILGSFAAGIAFSRRFIVPFASFLRDDEHDATCLEIVKQKMHPIIYLFSPIFFVYVGLSIDLTTIEYAAAGFWYLALTLTLIAFAGKFFGGFFVPGVGWKERAFLGLSMVPRGEVGLIFAEVGMSMGALQNQTYSTLILVVVVTTLIPPLLLRKVFYAENRQ